METGRIVDTAIRIKQTGYHGSVIILVDHTVMVRTLDAIKTQPSLTTLPACLQFNLIHFATAILAFIQHRISSLLFAPIHR